MCNRYVSPADYAMAQHWNLRRGHVWQPQSVYPRKPGPFIRSAKDVTELERELVIGQWALVPWFAKTPKLTYSTNNARFEDVAKTASYKQPWAKGQRCIIPALSFDEPNWESGKNEWWTFKRSDGAPWGLAGLWSTWIDKATGELVESYTMLTINADSHPLMRRMHKPDPKLGPGEQDKRSVVPIELEDVGTWLHGTMAEAAALVKVPGPEAFDAGPTGAPPPA